MSEKINHPSHYQREGRRECIEEIQDKYGIFITHIFCLTNAYKYLYRAGEKEGNSAEQDIAKAKWYFNYSQNLPVNEGEWTMAANNLWCDICEELNKIENNKIKL